MTRLRELARDLGRPDNVLSAVTIVTATILVLIEVFHGAVGEHVTAAITIALLGLVALSSMVERESRLAQTESKVDGVQCAVDRICHLLGESKGTRLFANDSLPVDRDTLLAGGTEVFVAGAFSFNLLTGDPERWRKWLNNHKSVKVIVQNPWNDGLRYLDIPAFNYHFETYRSNTEGVVKELESLGAPGSAMKIRLSDTCPTQGIVIVDGHKGGASMIVSLYLPGAGRANRPTMILNRERDPELFELFYQKYYVELWDKSRPHPCVPGEA